MSRLATLARQVLGLFVDDGSLAVAILVWVAVAGFLLGPSGVPEMWRSSLFFVGLALLLLENPRRSARRSC